MNVSAYLPDDLVQAVDRHAQTTRTSRSAVLREALEQYLKRMSTGAWPADLMAWEGDADFPPFESLRDETESTKDPFLELGSQ